MVYWITGVSGVGKSTLGSLLAKSLRETGRPVVYLDGDMLREVFGQDLGYGAGDRKKAALRYGRLCQVLSAQGFDVVMATISLFHEVQNWNRLHIPGYREIHVTAPLEVLKARDPKGIYKNAVGQSVGGPVVGLDLAPEEPMNPEVRLVNDGSRPAAELVQEIQRKLQVRRR